MMNNDYGVFGSLAVKQAIINVLLFWRAKPLPAMLLHSLLIRGMTAMPCELRAKNQE